MPPPPLKVFLSYAHKDAPFFEVFKEGVKSHLANSGVFNFSTWGDSDIPLGSNWDEEIQNNLGGSQLAILCVSSNFLNSRYIKKDEFEALINKYQGTLIIPVYFNHCNFNAWNDLAIKQFFKPSGDRYDEEVQQDFAFCDLVRFNNTNGALVPNPNIDLYFHDFVKKVESALSARYNIKVPDPVPDAQIKPAKEVVKPGKKISDKIVEIVIIAAIVLSLMFIFYTLVLTPHETTDSKKFNGTIGCAMFFGSIASFVFNKKLQYR